MRTCPLSQKTINETVVKKLCQTNILPPRVFHMRMRNALMQRRSTNGPQFKEDDCTLSAYLSLL